MSKNIHVLEQNIANKIAAGEVIERPASVIKELVENSADAGSTSITIEIKNAGINYIKVMDNGTGIEKDDVLIAFQRHATSKIKHEKDLYNINTLGFRGEALASIAAVSHIELITKTADSDEGKHVFLKGGKLIFNNAIGCPQGTAVIVKNLFFNTPARLKFLHSQGKETSAIYDIINRLILSKPNISIKFINNANTVIQSLGNEDILSSIACVYGKETAKSLIEINEERNNLRLSGFIGSPEISKNSRRNQSFFINGRYIRSRLISNALEQGYKTINMINRYPFAVLYMVMPSELTDVNVHPSKTEIKFEKEKEIEDAVAQTVREALLRELTGFYPLKEKTQPAQINEEVKSVKEEQEEFIKDKDSHLLYREKNKSKKPNYCIKQEIIDNNTNNGGLTGINSFIIVGRLFSTYIVIQDEEAFYLMDQHAAHERLLYEEYMEMYKKQKIYSQRVMTPILVELTSDVTELIKERGDLIRKFGFEYEVFGSNSVVLREVPILFNQPQAEEFFNQIADILFQGRSSENIMPSIEKKIIKMACKAGIKANDKLEDKEIIQLIKGITNNRIPYTCPHGRPIIIKTTRYELEKMFKRIQQ